MRTLSMRRPFGVPALPSLSGLEGVPSLHALDDATKFSLFQLVRVLRRSLGDGTSGRPSLRFRGDYSLAFPASDVGAAHGDESTSVGSGKSYHLTVRGAGLGGSGSPLPGHYVESWGRQDGATARAAALLDTTSHHVLDLLYHSWADPRRIAAADAGTHDHIASALLAAMGGLADAGSASTGAAEAMLAEAAARLRTNLTAASAERRLTRAFGGIAVRVVSNVPRRVGLPMAAMTKLGQAEHNNRLGGTFRLGRSVIDAKGKFRVVLGPAPMSALEKFLPPEGRREALGGVIERALGTPLCHDVEIRFGADLAPLGLTGRSRLGVTSHLGGRLQLATPGLGRASTVSVVLPEGGRHEHA